MAKDLKKRMLKPNGEPNCIDSIERICPACGLVQPEEIDAMVQKSIAACSDCGTLFVCEPRIVTYFTTRPISLDDAQRWRGLSFVELEAPKKRRRTA